MAVTNMLKDYVDKATRAYILMHPELNSKDVKKEVQSIVKEKIVIPEATFAKQKTNLMGVVKYIEDQKPILSGYGTMFKQHEEYMSVEYDMVDDFAITRGVYKSKKFEHINDEDKVLFNMYDIFQLTFKLLNNSFYGVENQPDSFFYHPLLGPSITQTGVIIITTSLNLFEKVMSNNFSFRRFTDVITYVDNILQEEYDIEDYIDSDSMVDVDTFVEYIYSHCKTQTDKMKDKITRLANNLSESELTKIYYKNNFYDFMNNSSDFTEVLSNLLGNEDFLDPNKPPEEYMECLEYLWQVFNIVIHYNHLDFYRMDNAKYEKRKTILTVDTDSNFLYLYPFFEYCKEMSGIEDKDIYRVTTINVIMYILTSLITEHYEMLTSSFGIKDADKRKFISMKNE